jgi:hypothetical protein
MNSSEASGIYAVRIGGEAAPGEYGLVTEFIGIYANYGYYPSEIIYQI